MLLLKILSFLIFQCIVNLFFYSIQVLDLKVTKIIPCSYMQKLHSLAREMNNKEITINKRKNAKHTKGKQEDTPLGVRYYS